LPTLPGLSWNTSQLYTTGVLSVAAAPGLPGDFNNDGIVNAADYVVWRKTGSPPDGYNTWRTNFGNADSGAGNTAHSNAPMPEPATCWLAIWSAALIAAARRTVLYCSARTRHIA
jgi:hypothetical protein